MYLGIDVGGTKVLVASLTNEGSITESVKFPTPQDYPEFVKQLEQNVKSLGNKEFRACGIAVPGLVDRKLGLGVAFGNLPWRNVPIQADVSKIAGCPVALDNDANLAALSEAILLKSKYAVVLYVTIGTGIGTGIINHCQIDEAFADTEGGLMMIEHNGHLRQWQEFASGKAIVRQFGQRASEITDPAIWQKIAENIGIGLIDLIATVQPNAIVLGGGIATHYAKFEKYLLKYLDNLETPMVKIPPILQAERPEEAVVYGCYHLAKTRYALVG